ncbi:MAG TPA: AMP-binding protein, partial [Chitinophagaceae bacterium]|nr:AMP-binding protein [Chitinophagaceae bacterium]
MEKIINKNTELFWLNKFSAGHDEYVFPWESAEEGEQYQLDIPVPAAAAVEILRVCKNSSQAVLTYFVAVLSVSLYRYLGRQEFIICTSSRDEILPLRMEVEGVYRNVLSQAKAVVAEAMQYADYSFDQFLEKRRKRDKHASDVPFKKVYIGYGEVNDHDLAICISGEFNLSVQFTAAPYLKEVAEGFVKSFIHVLVNARENLDIAVNEVDVLAKSLSYAPKDYGVWSVTELFRKQVEATPNNIALIHRDQKITYAQLWDASCKVAYQLGEPNQVVAILIDRSVEMITGLMGILLSGSAFLPIDPDYPEERISHILADSKAKCVLTSKKYASKFNTGVIFMEDIDAQPRALPAVSPSDLAYVIYTSGTTGLPNGVMIAHQSLVNLCQWHKEYYRLTTTDVSTKYAGFGFDATVWEIFPALLSGGSLYIIEEEIRFNLKALAENYTKHGVTISFLPTQLGEQFMQQETQPPTLKKLLVGGDKLKSLQSNLPYEVYNNYGPTENTVVATACKVNSNAKNIPIGKPIATSQVYILLPGTDQLQPVGVPGELCISGGCLALGYLGKPELTARKFTANPYAAGERLYRTG